MYICLNKKIFFSLSINSFKSLIISSNFFYSLSPKLFFDNFIEILRISRFEVWIFNNTELFLKLFEFKINFIRYKLSLRQSFKIKNSRLFFSLLKFSKNGNNFLSIFQFYRTFKNIIQSVISEF